LFELAFTVNIFSLRCALLLLRRLHVYPRNIDVDLHDEDTAMMVNQLADTQYCRPIQLKQLDRCIWCSEKAPGRSNHLGRCVYSAQVLSRCINRAIKW